jgi:hypothetical protein
MHDWDLTRRPSGKDFVGALRSEGFLVAAGRITSQAKDDFTSEVGRGYDRNSVSFFTSFSTRLCLFPAALRHSTYCHPPLRGVAASRVHTHKAEWGICCF